MEARGGGGRGAGTAPVREKPCVWEEREEVTEKGGGGAPMGQEHGCGK